MEMENQKISPVAFTGNAREYFGIWIVNLLLSLVTLGIYSAWAKVRRKKYFYNNTLIDNVGFDYHANPVSILKGRIIAFVFFFCYSQSVHINPFLPLVFLLIFFLALPWLVVRGSIFNARNTSHRGLRFDFIGKISEAVKIYIGLGALAIFTLYLALPFLEQRRHTYLMNNHLFGKTPLEMKAKVNEFYQVYLMLFLIPMVIFVIGILAAIAIPAYQGHQTKATAQAKTSIPNVQPFATIQKTPVLLAANEEVSPSKVERVYSDNASAETLPAEAVTAANVAEQAADAVVDEPQEQTPEALAVQAEEEQVLEEQADEEQVIAQEEMSPIEQEKEKQRKQLEVFKNIFSNASATFIFLGLMLAYLAVIFGMLGFIKARIGNLIWNNTSLDNLSFKSSLRARDFIWLYFSNTLAIMCTFGLATPWAQVRMARYRASKLQIIGDVDFDQFVGDKKAEVQAAGEEIADFFDVDLSFG